MLPPALLAKILGRLPLAQRLRDAALVSRAWKDAAAQATTELSVSVKAASSPGLKAWVTEHADQIVSLQLSQQYQMVSSWAENGSGEGLVLELPWERLNHLHTLVLLSMKLAQVDSTAETAASPLLPALKQLKLTSVDLHSVECFVALASGTALTSLEVSAHGILDLDREGEKGEAANAAILSVLQQQQHLQQLHLGVGCASSKMIAAIATMTQLQDLDLIVGDSDSDSSLADLPSTLMRLRLRDASDEDIQYAPGDSSPTLPLQHHLSSLQRLDVTNCRLLPAALASMTALQHLHLEECFLLPFGGEQPTTEGGFGPLLSPRPPCCCVSPKYPHLLHKSIGHSVPSHCVCQHSQSQQFTNFINTLTVLSASA